uniref:Spastin n=1 Tax=Magallana gigas TaxID=29159 RepID=K1RLV0_MAGGI
MSDLGLLWISLGSARSELWAPIADQKPTLSGTESRLGFAWVRRLSGLSAKEVKTVDANQVRNIKKEDFEEALRRIRRSVAPDSLKQYEDWNSEYGAAMYESTTEHLFE